MNRRILIAALLVATARAGEPTPLTPDFPAFVDERIVATWTFDQPADQWTPLHACSLAVTNGVLRVASQGEDPYLRIPAAPLAGPVVLRWTMRTTAQGPVEVFWASDASPDMGKNGSIRLPGVNDGNWHTCEVVVATTERIQVLRLDPCTTPGLVEIAEASLLQRQLHPLQFERIEADGMTVRGAIRNTQTNTQSFTLGGRTYEAGPGQTVAFETIAPGEGAFRTFRLSAAGDGVPPLERTLHLYDPAARLDSRDFGNSNVLVQVARDRSGARILWKGQPAAIVMPLPAQCELTVEGDDIVVVVQPAPGGQAPMIRALGALRQGLLAGVEYLGRGESSSTALDLERPERIRFEPPRDWLTMPLAAYVTERATVAMAWDDMELQPVFSTPNRYDGTADHLMGLKGGALRFRLHLADPSDTGHGLDEAIVWAVRRRGLPEPPPPPRDAEAQRALCLAAMNGPLRTSNGWYHAMWPGQPQHFFVDHASTLFLLTGAPPDVPDLVPNGAHVGNPAAWLVTGRAEQWLRHLKGAAVNAMAEQKPDGSFRYDGRFRRGHFEDTASGHCAVKILPALDCAFYTGDPAALAAGVKTLEFMKRFVTPRGAQVWEIPLHTPDILAAADCCRVYLRGYELTGRAEYLDLARRWAIRGLPFVYQWGRHPVMSYGTIAVLGATDWTGVVWIGLPVQWCGTVYAYALTELAAHDRMLDWQRVATGILRTAQQMQYPDGESIGTLPDSFQLADQRRLPACVNPCVIVALQERLAGRLDAVAVATGGAHRVAAPFPVRIEGGHAVVEGRAGLAYQVVVDGARVVDVRSQGRDTISLAE